MLRTSVVAHHTEGRRRAERDPSEAEATLDIRALPDEDVDKFYAEMPRVIADPAVKLVPIAADPAAVPGVADSTPRCIAMEQVARTPLSGCTVLPSMSTGARDQAQLRAKGIQSYGIGRRQRNRTRPTIRAHGDVERLAESWLLSIRPDTSGTW